MLGVRLSSETERRLERHAREAGRPKSVIVRDWIIDRLDREEVDELIRTAARLHASDREGFDERIAATAAQLRQLDAEDGGYDWGPPGPPVLR